MEIKTFFENFGEINVANTSNARLSKIIRQNYGCDLRLSFNIALMIKEAYCLGMIRGAIVNNE